MYKNTQPYMYDTHDWISILVLTISLITIFDIITGFDFLLHQLNDLSLDTPNASEVLGNFIARAIADDCLPPAYVQNHQNITDTKAL